MSAKRLFGLLLVPLALMLGGCHKLVLLYPEGHVAQQQSDIMISTTIIIALIIVPVLIAIGVVAWRYRASNKNARYEPKWDHSSQLELLVWAGPLLIIIAVGAVSWIGTHKTDPYRELDHTELGHAADAVVKPLKVEVVSLRWKWLFFYPQYGIATVNELAAPVDRPIKFHITSSDMMDAFFVPDLAGMIYTMPGMQTQLHAVIDKPGKYKGLSSNFSGAGFSHMHFWFYGMTKGDFGKWVAKVRSKGSDLTNDAYLKLAKDSIDEPVHYYSSYASGLYTRILNQCVVPGQACINKHMAHSEKAPNYWDLEGSGESADAASDASTPAAAAAAH